MQKFMTILFLFLEVGALLTFLRGGIFHPIVLILILMIALNVLRLYEWFKPKQEKKPTQSRPEPEVPAQPMPEPEKTVIMEKTEGSAPATPVPAAPMQKTEGEVPEEPWEEYRERAFKLMEEDPEITVRICGSCGKSYPFNLPRCPYCGRY